MSEKPKATAAEKPEVKKVDIDFIVDAEREKAKERAMRRIEKGRSVLFYGNYGVGKSAMLAHLVAELKKTRTVVEVRPLGGVFQLLGEMCGVMEAGHWNKNKYLQTLCDHPRIIVIDEAQHLKHEIFPYLKIIMDAGNIVIFGGLTELIDKMKARHPDILSRMMRLEVLPIKFDDLKAEVNKTDMPQFNNDALTMIYNGESMRVWIEAIENCRAYAFKNGLEVIDYNIVEMFTED